MKKQRNQDRFRLLVQALAFAFSNGYVYGWVTGKIYTGTAKKVCLPGLNCYSCPGAVFACPVGALQAVLGSGKFRVSLYVFGWTGMLGMFFGRLICGWFCPFGFIQDLLYKIPVFRKIKNLPGHRILNYLKYVLLALFVIILPMAVTGPTGTGSPRFCEYICPAGTLLGGIPLTLFHESLRDAAGLRFLGKTVLLLAILLCAVKAYRPFCKYLCPLGALYSLANPVALYRFRIDEQACVRCGACQKVCGMDLRVWEQPNSPECIRCGKCRSACPRGAITSTWENLEKKITIRTGNAGDR